jgi:hypothetical protein
MDIKVLWDQARRTLRGQFKELFNAARNVTYPGERTAVERITAGFEEYVGDISVMRHEYQPPLRAC